MAAPPPPPAPVPAAVPAVNNPVLEELQSKHIYNPKEFDLSAKNARFFVIKSYSEDDIHRSIKYEIWCSTEHGNKRLDAAFRERDGKGPVYLYFSVNGSGHFCGMAEMVFETFFQLFLVISTKNVFFFILKDVGGGHVVDAVGLVAGQVARPIYRQVDLRQGRAQRGPAPHSTGEQREQAGDQLARHPGGPRRQGPSGSSLSSIYFQSICVTNCKIAGAQDPALVPTRHVHFRRFQPLRETTGGGRPAEDDHLVPWRRRQLRKRPNSSSAATAARKRPRLVQAAAVGPSRRRIRTRK